MNDIVERLRNRDCAPYCDQLSAEAATDIERLRAERDALRTMLLNERNEWDAQHQRQAGVNASLAAERDALRARVVELEGLLREARPAIGEGQLAARIDAAMTVIEGKK